MAAAVLYVVFSVLLLGVVMAGLASVAGIWRARRLDREMREQERDKDAGFAVSYTGVEIYVPLVFALTMLAVGGFKLVRGVFFLRPCPGVRAGVNLAIGENMFFLVWALWSFMMVWRRTGMRLSIHGDRITLMRWHRVHRLDVSGLVSAQDVHEMDRNGDKGLKLGFRYPGSPRVHHMTLWEVVTHYGRLRIWMARHDYIPDDQQKPNGNHRSMTDGIARRYKHNDSADSRG